MANISIIIPVYNTSKYLRRCLDSVMNQTYNDFEALLIDDGSTDSSFQICQEYVAKDHRFKVYYEKNSGLSAARNYGIMLAQSNYLAFIDSDDFVSKDYLETLWNQIQKYHSDIAICSYYQITDNGTYYFPLNPNGDDRSLDGLYDSEQWSKVSFLHNGIIHITAWGKLYKRSVFKHVYYPEQFASGEDQFTTWKTYMNANKISFINVQNYAYQKNSGSITHTKNHAVKYGVIALENKISAFLNYGWDPTYMKPLYLQRLRNLYDTAISRGDYFTAENTKFKLLKFESSK